MRTAPEPDSRILVIQTAFLGDVILATPLLFALRRLYPRSFIAFMGTPAGCGLLEGLAAVDEFIVFDKRGEASGFAGLKSMAAKLASYEFDLAVSAHRSLRTAALLMLAKIPFRVGFATAPAPWFYHERVPRDPGVHEIERNLGLLDPLGGLPEDFEPRLTMPELTAADEDLLGTQPPGVRVGICPGSVWPTKRWSAPGFARVADTLQSSQGARVFLIGSKADREVADEVESASSTGLVNLVGKTSLREWARLIAAMDLVITNDSAPTHIAGALGKPVVVIYGPTTPGQGFAPRGESSRVVEIDALGCRPCGRHGAKRCPEGHFKCMELIRPDYVVATVRSMLAAGVADE